jgi:ABC-type protease/lipase transport system fused ATPase/permease subunit
MDVRSLGNDFFFENVGYLPQQVLLYPGTVGDNIARLSERNKEKILEAAQAAGCHELIAQLPKGYDTEVGPNGGNLSLGQQQRIALARAMYGRPAYLFLDEPNSNLDSEGEAALKQAIANAANQGVTAILVAHRSSMLTLCNKVLVLNNGQQMLFGPRDEVLQKIASETRGNA